LRLLLTRPIEDSRPLAKRLEALGHSVLIEPLLSIHRLPTAVDLSGVQALAVTSRHALLADARLRVLPLFAVGGATAERARALGYRQVIDADGDAAALAALIRQRLDPQAGGILHLTGELPSGLASLAGAGFTLRVVRCYRTQPTRMLSAVCQDALAGNCLDGAAFLSPKTAETFVTLAREAGLAEACRGLAAFCLSHAVAGMLDSRSWRRVVVATRPRLDDLIAAVAATELEESPRL
jgi:uroporphyrinogen-III synthase